jgi:hypothetical protein
MFDDKKAPISLQEDPKPPKLGRAPILWEKMPEEELLAHFTEMREFLPSLKVGGMNVEEELMLQYRTLKIAQREALDDPDTPASAKASISNSVSSTLAKIAALQNDIYTSERFKSIELALIRLLKTWPEDQTRQFLEEYKNILGTSA